MTHHHVLRRVVTLAATAAVIAGASASPAFAQVVPTRHAVSPRGSAVGLEAVRAEQQRMAALPDAAPVLSPLVTTTTFTVNTTDDSNLANPASTACHDAADGKCSLRAAVSAANNRKTPVRVLLGSHTYTLTLGLALSVTDPAGVSIVGKGATLTKIAGDGSGVFQVVGPSGALLILTGLTVTGGTTGSGGGIYLNSSGVGSTAVLKNVVITHNTATTRGGGIYASDYGTLYMTNTKITNNTAPQGGGMYSYWLNGRFVDSTIADNSTPAVAGGSGGGIYNLYGVLEITGGSISNNTAGTDTFSGVGGGIVDSYGDITLSGVVMNGNTAKDGGLGGAIAASEDQLDITKSSISGNSALGAFSSGGGIYAISGAQIALHGVTMAANHAGSAQEGAGGGAIFVHAEQYGTQLVIDSGSKITGATASAIYVYAFDGAADVSISNSTLSGNHSNRSNGVGGNGCGGAVCAYNNNAGSITVEMTHDTVSGNSSLGNNSGGAITFFGAQSGGGTLILRSNKFLNNTTGGGGDGGAVLAFQPSSSASAPVSIRSYSNTFSHNTAGTASNEGFGGAIGLDGYAVLSDSGSKFIGNRSLGDPGNGGAVFDGSGQSASYTRSTFSGNSAGGNGGAVYTDNEAGVVFNQVTIAGNTAKHAGGGVYGDGDAYRLEFRRSTISGNTAGTSTTAGQGGGIFAGDAVAVFENSTVSGNRALSHGATAGEGGGIWASGSSLGLRYTTVSANYAAVGGGIYVDHGGSVLASIVSGNHKAPGGLEQDCAASDPTTRLLSVGENVLGKASCVVTALSSDKITTHPGLQSLANNGGSTKTMALTAASPAIDRGGDFCPATDQRGHVRHAAHCDAGAYER